MTRTNMEDDKLDTRDSFDRALERFRKDVVPVDDEARAAERRERLVPALTSFVDREFERKRARERWVRAGIAGGVVAAAAAILFLVAQRGEAPGATPSSVPTAALIAAEGSVQVGKPGASAASAATHAMPLGGSDRVRTEDGTAEVSLRTGARVQLAPHTELELGSAERQGTALDERVRLAAGSIQVRVPKLPRGSLVVNTPHAAVTVHGTVFSVDVRGADGATPARTIVSVTEGKVSVASGGREIFLTPGATWSSASTDESAGGDEATPLGPDSRDGGGTAARERVRSAKQSTLREENELFRGALEAKRTGNPVRTLELLDELLRRYPATPLRGAAAREHARAEAQLRAKPSSP